jgi:ActR/RegA family two-component response regulator
MANKMLFVDDEPAVLDGYKRLLHRDFEVDTAVGGELGLASIQEKGPYAVVISDMRMPGMDGAQFLAAVRKTAPDTVRMLLTGYTDMKAAMDAVNEGNIFRFLTKPCEKDVLGKALTTGLVQHRLMVAEKELLEKTLMGSIKILTDVLSAASPEAFGRSMRIARYVRYLVNECRLPLQWRFEAAAMLSQLGCVTLEPELIRAAYVGNGLSPEDQARFNAHPAAARDLLANIPRLEPIAWMISQQLINEVESNVPSKPITSADDIVLGARILRLAVAFDDLKTKGLSDEDALNRLGARHNESERKLIDALKNIKPDGATMSLRKVATAKLSAGMILQQEIRSRTGILVVASGQEVTHALLIKLSNFSRAGTIDKEVMAMVPV